MQTVPCKFCGLNTRMTETKECDACWELKGRMERADPTVLRRITKAIADAKKKDEVVFRETASRRVAGPLSQEEADTTFGDLDRIKYGEDHGTAD